MRQRIHHVLIFAGMTGLLAVLAWSAQAAGSPFRLTAFTHRASGASQVFTVEAVNDTAQGVTLHGRIIAVSVYDTSKPMVLTFADQQLPPRGTATFSALWPDAPLFGRMHALLVLTDGSGESTVAATDFWVFPVSPGILIDIGAGALLLIFLIVVIRAIAKRPHHEHVPAHTVAYRVEGDDTVVSIANRYGVTWQDVVRANQLKAPYELKPGKRLFIPRHALAHPPEPERRQPPTQTR